MSGEKLEDNSRSLYKKYIALFDLQKMWYVWKIIALPNN